MKYFTSNEIREKFLHFFEKKGHKRLPSSSLIPNDPQLLFTVAGMVPFKPIFWGKVEPTYTRITTCQKCLRTNDIENVGRTPRHHTFFEMLGNFSFGDYFKKEAIKWAWEFLTEELELPAEKLWASVYETDDEAFNIWKDDIKIPENKILRFGKEENWWGPAGPTGPCGPCSEIYFDTGYTENCPDQENCTPACDCGRFVEIWNIVFTEYYSDENGKLSPLPRKNIDTGAGFERICAVAQGKYDNFDSDLFKETIEEIQRIFDVKFRENKSKDVSIKVIADHSRAIAFLITEGIIPSNEGRGYVLRRLIRRAVRHGALLGAKEPFLNSILEKVIKKMSNIYPELIEKEGLIKDISSMEEEKFFETMEKGMERLNNIIQNLNNEATLSGKIAFELYDTYGFPLDLTKEILSEKGIEVDEKEFTELMNKQRELARAASGKVEYDTAKQIYKEIDKFLTPTEFIGYDKLSSIEEIQLIIKGESIVQQAQDGDEIELFFSKTPFYAERGGQISDNGIIYNETFEAEVIHVKPIRNGIISHLVKIKKGSIKNGERVFLKVDEKKRKATEKNHTATHLLHSALRKVIGEHIRQAGSYVAPERLRFDFTHYEPLTPDQIKQIEYLVNEQIQKAIPVNIYLKSLEEAKNMDVIALFEEKYGEMVRIVEIDDFSRELCGGTHVSNTGEIGLFKILEESSISSGVRRIEAITGLESLNYVTELESIIINLSKMLDSSRDQIPDKIQGILKTIKNQEKEIKQLQFQLATKNIERLAQTPQIIEGEKVVVAQLENLEKDVHANTADILLQKLGRGVVILFNKNNNDQVSLVVKVSKDISKKFHAGNIAKKIASYLGGGGGGGPTFAQAGGKYVNKLNEVIEHINNFMEV
ncbi:alanyl-tRNA synthetase [Petrotoga sp. HKA.pet.4.5]|jgi:alanyl-tRNA synthetase|uniref:alanine--tRNA ligase n=1 Tax=unclassified Petrotoga TaxID=2620614 RepID=UPI000EF1570D|nr:MULTISPECIES: alanine--tRNA ligase [unclassified Petrotoga]RLL82732.1 alanyl-tRNA synthetase [Petrotoga sp. Shatin.DS.tank11.9.2.9.3]RLL89962.1 alanyl-tRNA synthetase [Petrotoga sp. HKA.pet.4.5]